MTRLASRSVLLLIALILACSPKQETPEKNTVNIGNGSLEISNGWARPAHARMMTAAYFTIRNNETFADTLLSVSYANADDTQIHESYEADGGMMGMRPVGAVPIPANSGVELKPGGIHVMIIRPEMNLSEGDSIVLELAFSSNELQLIRIPVKASN
ncbi:MAG: copper chaperone PCu(A)C [Balneolaceae bacterium]|nr:copper chaperone PCu(A)C [Balneolaceae bacterium]